MMKVNIRIWRWTSQRQRWWWKTTQQYMSTTLRSKTLKGKSAWDRDTATETKTKTGGFKEESRLDGQHSPSTTMSSTVTLVHAWTDKSTTRVYFQQWYMARKHGHSSQAKNKLAAAQTKMERSMLNITYRDRKRWSSCYLPSNGTMGKSNGDSSHYKTSFVSICQQQV